MAPKSWVGALTGHGVLQSQGVNLWSFVSKASGMPLAEAALEDSSRCGEVLGVSGDPWADEDAQLPLGIAHKGADT